mgnify:CR=1 FL=1
MYGYFVYCDFVFGTAEIDGRSLIVSGDDFTVRGGSADASISAKRNQAEGLAHELRVPHLRLVDGMGGGGSVKRMYSLVRAKLLGRELSIGFLKNLRDFDD